MGAGGGGQGGGVGGIPAASSSSIFMFYCQPRFPRKQPFYGQLRGTRIPTSSI